MKLHFLFFTTIIFTGIVCLMSCLSNVVTTETTLSSKDSILVEFSSLPVLSANYQYENWLVDATGNLYTAGKFEFTSTDPNERAKSFSGSFYVGESIIKDASQYFISIEPANDTKAAPSSTILFGATFDTTTDTVATIDLNHTRAFGSGFLGELEQTKVKFRIATPTDGNNNMNEDAGLWFIDKDASGNIVAGIENLPILPSGWKYEGWVVQNGAITPANPNMPVRAVTTGKFIAATGKDEFDAYSSTVASGPNYPGEDFLVNAPQGVIFPLHLTANQDLIAISLEPNPDDDSRPFHLKPFVATLPKVSSDSTYDNVIYNLGVSSAIPTGTVKRTL